MIQATFKVEMLLHCWTKILSHHSITPNHTWYSLTVYIKTKYNHRFPLLSSSSVCSWTSSKHFSNSSMCCWHFSNCSLKWYSLISDYKKFQNLETTKLQDSHTTEPKNTEQMARTNISLFSYIFQVLQEHW